jgi:predicted RNase H-like HicB family nuclease
VARYPAVVHRGRRRNSYGVKFPDFPGCISAGDTAEEAFRLAEEALQLHVDGMVDDGEELPEPSSIEDLYLAFAGEQVVIGLVPVLVPAPTRRINISIDGNLLEAIDAAARARGQTRSGFLSEGARTILSRR